MGVINSKNIKGVKGDENKSATNTGTEEPPPEEALAEDDLLMKEINKWKPFMKDIFALPNIISKLKSLELAEKTKIEEKKGIIVDSTNVKKFITGDKDFLPDVMLYFGEVGLKDIENTEIQEKEFKFDKEKAESISMPGDIKNLKKEATKEQINPIYDSIINATRVAKKHAVFRRIIRDYITDSDKFKDYMKKENISDSRQDILSGDLEAIDEAHQKIKAKEEETDKTGEEAKKGGGGGSDYNTSEDGGSLDSNSSSSERSSLHSDSSSEGGTLRSEDNQSLNSNYSGGIRVYGFRTAKELQENKSRADYKQFKKDARGDFDKKMYSFLADNEAMATFMDESSNQANLLKMVYYGKIPKKWINKEATNQKEAVAQALVDAINKYIPKEEEPPVNPADGAAAPEANGANGDENGEPPADENGGQSSAPPAKTENGGTSEGGTLQETPLSPPPENNNTVPSGGDQALQLADMFKNSLLETVGLQQNNHNATQNVSAEVTPTTTASLQTVQTGGGERENEKRKRKKKRKGKKKQVDEKKPKQINISINVGNKNIIIDETSSESDSDSSSSSSSSSSDSDSNTSSSCDDTTSSSSSSDNDDDEDGSNEQRKNKQHKKEQRKKEERKKEQRKKKQHKKKDKYVVNN